MRYDVPTGLIIGAALSKKLGRITNFDLIALNISIRENAPRYYVDFSLDSIYSEIEANCDCFVFEHDQIRLNDFYMENMGRIKRYFYDVLDEEVRNAIDIALV
ncbi:MAG: hypothetical protein LBB91_05755 [Clostridiales bacterium]|jgi:hypothetical protein|nr:hypothetical protein [Clostridiales bacterium]